MPGESGDGRRFKQDVQRHLHSKHILNPRHHLRRQQRMAPQPKKVALNSHSPHHQHPPPSPRHHLPHLIPLPSHPPRLVTLSLRHLPSTSHPLPSSTSLARSPVPSPQQAHPRSAPPPQSARAPLAPSLYTPPPPRPPTPPSSPRPTHTPGYW